MKLKTILRANASTCLIFGAIFAVSPATTSSFLSASPAPQMVISLIGIILFLNGIHLLWVARKKTPPKWEIYYFSGSDFAWVAITCALILTKLWITTPLGMASAIAIAAIVGFFGITQLRAAQSL